MARFQYRMQSILNIKMKMETQAKQEFAAAKLALDKEEEGLKKLRMRKVEYEQEARRLRNGGLHVQDIKDNITAVSCMEEYIKAQVLQVRMAEAQVERARNRLKEVMQERKTHELLKEKAFDEFLREEGRRESKEIDELTSYTYGQKQVKENGKTG